jgi:16S rRNA (guanine527-N7)-methyltransferase
VIEIDFPVPGWLDVSRETVEKLVVFQKLVEKWNPAINLISKSKISDLWERHILDSAQLIRFCPANRTHWCDLGSGGGFPGIVIAILAEARFPDLRLTMVESDRRKSVFLGQAVRELSLTARVEALRIEAIPPLKSQVVSARALASLKDLLPLVQRHTAADGLAILPKGMNAQQEIADAREDWSFEVEEHKSLTSHEATILILKDIVHG